MATSLILRSVKGSGLTNAEMDGNFQNLRATADAAMTLAQAGGGGSGTTAVLTGLNTATPTVVTDADSILIAIGKLQAQISAGVGSPAATSAYADNYANNYA